MNERTLTAVVVVVFRVRWLVVWRMRSTNATFLYHYSYFFVDVLFWSHAAKAIIVPCSLHLAYVMQAHIFYHILHHKKNCIRKIIFEKNSVAKSSLAVKQNSLSSTIAAGACDAIVRCRRNGS